MGVLEIPANGAKVSGVGIASGWVCGGETIEIQFDDHEPLRAASGTSRNDTEDDCGDIDNGFALLFNWNLLGDGRHTAVVRVDGVELARSEFEVTTLGTRFLRGAKRKEVLAGRFAGHTVAVEWSEAFQNFVISKSR
jgi:hypothetical protein